MKAYAGHEVGATGVGDRGIFADNVVGEGQFTSEPLPAPSWLVEEVLLGAET